MKLDARQVFARNLRTVMAKLGVDQLEMARALKKTPSTVSDWCTGKKYPRVDNMQQIADFLGVSMNNLTNSNVFVHNNVVPVPEMRQIPLFVGGIACGDPLFVTDETEYISLPKHINADFAVICKGDSMINAHIKDGSIVYIRKQPTVNNGEIAAVLIDDSATLKRVFLEKNRLTLYPANDAYLPKVYQDEELENVQILGKAVAYTSNI